LETFPKSNDNIIERDKIYISNIKIHYRSILWLGHVYTINAIYHQITKGKDENLVKYHASSTVRTISYYSKVRDVIYTEGEKKRKVNILGDLILFLKSNEILKTC
jgi:hypothetical protein